MFDLIRCGQVITRKGRSIVGLFAEEVVIILEGALRFYARIFMGLMGAWDLNTFEALKSKLISRGT